MPGLLPWQTYLLAFVIGILGIRFPLAAVAALSLLAVADSVLRGSACRLPVWAVILCAFFGFAYASQRTPTLPDAIPERVAARKAVVLEGVVDRAEPRTGNRLRVILKQVILDREDGKPGEPLPGGVALSLRNTNYAPLPGQRARVVCRVVPVRSFGNPGMWDFEWYWQRQSVFWRGWPVSRNKPVWGERPALSLAGMRAGLRALVARTLPDTRGGAMVLALTTGDRSRLDQATMDATRSAGLAHTLALSGLHVGFVAAMGFALAWLAGRLWPGLLLYLPRPKLAVLLAAPLVLAYAWLGQPSASLIRASVMFGFWGVLLLQGRGRVLMDGLFFALAAIIFVSPLSAFDLGLQMSLAAVAGIGLLYPLFRSLFYVGRSLPARLFYWAAGVIAVSVCATVAIMPLVSVYFGTFCPNLLLNLIWLPVLGFAVMPLGLLGMLLTVFGWTAPAGALLLGWAARIADGLLLLLDAAQGAGFTPVFAVLRPMWPELLGFTLLLVTAAVCLRGRRVPVLLAGIGFVLLVAPHVQVMAEDSRDRTSLAMLDVGLGQSLVVSLPGGHRWLVDTGGGSPTFDLGEAVVGPSLTIGRPPRLDGIFLSHPDVDHSHGLPFFIERFDVGAFYTNGMLPRGLTGKRLRRVLPGSGVVPVALSTGDSVELASGARMVVLHPGEGCDETRANERSLVLRLERDGRPLALLPGDVGSRGIRELLGGGMDLSAEVLVLPHHGSRGSFVKGFYAAVGPEAILCSNGFMNRYGFPARVVKEAACAAAEGGVWTTARNGRVVCRWDGSNGVLLVSPWVAGSACQRHTPDIGVRIGSVSRMD
ncbi:DNA internalization-related competence protein ComEC/Rec2 [Pseudodesulfovibrio thermohalotolerans]|uniref:DNA internalization-related competence protein ComEC/Rec2 n=1 Tax=Pseudodesulfovibrio thermohalotolerans TaxID=2880651 RepID=UPI0024410D14|nr:DNA internalization-related competence protein ComEC/Rec2 [Pseudodesulfovibrio thermohalotolerans]WFS61384.1 DNA internalization-related competence protein ComEC/Rec2 [Pseudodesulfovibrio thermohalotolerans]